MEKDDSCNELHGAVNPDKHPRDHHTDVALEIYDSRQICWTLQDPAKAGSRNCCKRSCEMVISSDVVAVSRSYLGCGRGTTQQELTLLSRYTECSVELCGFPAFMMLHSELWSRHYRQNNVYNAGLPIVRVSQAPNETDRSDGVKQHVLHPRTCKRINFGV